MHWGYSTENLKTLVVWASNDFLPAGVIQLKVSSVRYKKKRCTAAVIADPVPKDTCRSNSFIDVNLEGAEFTLDNSNVAVSGIDLVMRRLKRKAANALASDEENEVPGKQIYPNLSDDLFIHRDSTRWCPPNGERTICQWGRHCQSH